MPLTFFVLLLKDDLFFSSPELLENVPGGQFEHEVTDALTDPAQ